MSLGIKEAINVRYSNLAEKSCCLSCGGAVNYCDIKEGNICVDLGSGRGIDTIKMSEKTGKTGHVFGIDISEGMINKAKKNAEKFNLKNATFLHAELESLPIKDESVDLVISNCTINHAQDKQKVWNEVYRILKPAGYFVVSDIYSSEPVPGEYKNDPQAVAECWAGSVTKETYLEQLSKAGFKDLEIIEESKPYEKGKITVSSWTIKGKKEKTSCGCSCSCNYSQN